MILPPKKETMFIPQKPYMPMGTLAEAAPVSGYRAFAGRSGRSLRVLRGLSHLIPLLDSEGDSEPYPLFG